MLNCNIKYLRGRNVLCFGDPGVEFRFSDFGNVVQVKGINLDMPGTNDQPASNGTGKSSIQELLSIGFFGRMVKHPTKNKGGDILNINATEGEVEIHWDDFRLVRTFKKSKSGTVTSKLEVWKSDQQIWDKESCQTRGEKDDTQSYIEAQIKLSHHAFCNVVIFDDANTYSFLEADTATKRMIVENLLDLDQYRTYHQSAKDHLKDAKKIVEVLAAEYSRLCDDVEASDRRLTTVVTQEGVWRTNKKNEIAKLEQLVAAKQTGLESTSNGYALTQWQQCQAQIPILTEQTTENEGKLEKLKAAISVAKAKLEEAKTARQRINETIQGHLIAAKQAEAGIEANRKIVINLKSLAPGQKCPTCHGPIDLKNSADVAKHAENEIAAHDRTLLVENASIADCRRQFGEKSATVSLIEEKLVEAEKKLCQLEKTIAESRRQIALYTAMPKPDADMNAKLLENEIVDLKRQVLEKNTELGGISPYKEIIEQAIAERDDAVAKKSAKADELTAAEAEIPYCQYWVEAFGDNGIRKYVIDGVIPALNARVAHWLEILIEGKITVTFDNKLDQTITRNGNSAKYYNMSNGEVRRVNLAVSQAFAYVMMLNSGSCPSIVFLDEITGGGIDKAGIIGIYNMIFELAKERQVFVTTHSESLMTMLAGCETITLRKHNDLTAIAA